MGSRFRWILIVVALDAGSAYAHSSDLPAGLAGVPASEATAAEPGCLACHADAGRDARAGGIELTGLPERYVPGQRYALDFAVRHADADRLRWGFVVTAVAAKTLVGAGQLRATDLRHTRIVRGPAGRQYVSHTYSGTAIGQPRGQHWRFEWIAPGVEAGEVAFYVSAVAADADGSEAGDLVYTGVTIGVVPDAVREPRTPLAPSVPIDGE